MRTKIGTGSVLLNVIRLTFYLFLIVWPPITHFKYYSWTQRGTYITDSKVCLEILDSVIIRLGLRSNISLQDEWIYIIKIPMAYWNKYTSINTSMELVWRTGLRAHVRLFNAICIDCISKTFLINKAIFDLIFRKVTNAFLP